MGTDPKTISVANKADDLDLSSLNAPAEPVAEAKPEIKPEVKPEPVKPAHPGWLVDEAISLGADHDWINQFTPKQLHDRIIAFKSQRAAPAPPAPAAAPKEDEDFDIGLDEKDHDPLFVKALKNVSRATIKKVEAKFQARLDEMTKREQERETQRVYGRFDDAFEDLPDDIQKFVSSDAPGCVAMRNAILQDAKVDHAQLPGHKPLIKLLEKHARKILQLEAKKPEPKAEPKAEEAEAEKPTNGKYTVAESLEAGLGRPTAVKKRKTKGEQEADNELAEVMASMNFRGNRTNNTDLSGLPD